MSTVSATALKEKFTELSLISLLCSCMHNNKVKDEVIKYGDMQVKQLDKSGKAFEVVIKPPSKDPSEVKLSSPPRSPTCLDAKTIQEKLEKAEERRKSMEAETLKKLAKEREHQTEVLSKAAEVEAAFAKKAQEELKKKQELYEQNQQAQRQAKIERLKEMDQHAEVVRQNKMIMTNSPKA
ncbi:STMN3 [Branchiostoma lanceolatum]|nr:STMN3 [Branchiostoma lanceolatum]